MNNIMRICEYYYDKSQLSNASESNSSSVSCTTHILLCEGNADMNPFR